MKTITSAEYHAWLDHPLTKALKQSFEQSVTDPENQPSQYGTVTLEMYETELRKTAELEAALKVARDALKGFDYDKRMEAIAEIEGVLKHA